jgi:hypothetical protein
MNTFEDIEGPRRPTSGVRGAVRASTPTVRRRAEDQRDLARSRDCGASPSMDGLGRELRPERVEFCPEVFGRDVGQRSVWLGQCHPYE